jgi:hypothetical protein
VISDHPNKTYRTIRSEQDVLNKTNRTSPGISKYPAAQKSRRDGDPRAVRLRSEIHLATDAATEHLCYNPSRVPSGAPPRGGPRG